MAGPRPRKVDVAVIGAGTAGLVARRAAEAAGARTLLIGQPPLGTTCARVGCMPSKLLIAAADAAHDARRAHDFGVRAGPVTVDGRAVMARVRAQRDRFVRFVLEATDALEAGDTLVRGTARFDGDHRLVVDTASGERVVVEAGAIVVATGSTPHVPPPFRSLGDALVTTDSLFERDTLPDSALIVGTGVIALELGQALSRLGSRVTFVGLDEQLGVVTDPAVASAARSIFGRELDLVTSYTLEAVTREADGAVRARFRDGAGARRDERYACVLVAAGRLPHLASLGFQRTSVPLEDRERWVVDPLTLQLADAPLFVAGDAAGHRPLLHEAADEGHIAGQNAAALALGGDVRAFVRKVALSIVFTDPQMAVIGPGWSALSHEDVRCGRVDFGDQGRATVMGVNAGVGRVYGERSTARLLGAELLGPRAEHLAHLLAFMVQRGLTVDEALELPFYHPVVEEGLRTALRALQRALRHAGPEPHPCEDTGPGA